MNLYQGIIAGFWHHNAHLRPGDAKQVWLRGSIMVQRGCRMVATFYYGWDATRTGYHEAAQRAALHHITKRGTK